MEPVMSPETLMAAAAEGRWPKDALAPLLNLDARRRFLQACAAIERHYTEACAPEGGPCLEPGCAVAGGNGEVCLQPLLRSAAEYHKACGAEWATLFAASANRTDGWAHAVPELVAEDAGTARR